MQAGILTRIYGYPMVRREWRAELDSWLAADVCMPSLANDVTDGANRWGRPASRLPHANGPSATLTGTTQCSSTE
jgi:hypothetical protein